MRSYSYLATVALIAVPLTAAQSIQDLQSLPICAQPSAEKAFAATGCGLNEPVCVCKNADFKKQLTDAVESLCKAPDQAKVVEFTVGFCAKAGIVVDVPQTTEAAAQSLLNPTPAPSPAAATSSAAPPPPPPSSSAAAPSSAAAASSSSSSSSTSASLPTSVLSYNGTNSTSFGTPESFFGAASTNMAGSWTLGCSVVGIVLGLVML